MTEEEAQGEATKVIDRHRKWARPLTSNDFIELKKFIRIARIIPRGGHRHLKEFKYLYDKFGHWTFTHINTEEFNTLMEEVTIELEVDPPSYEELVMVADLAIKVAASPKITP